MVETLLMVDDDPRDTALMARALKKAGISLEVVTVADGFEALDYLLARGAWGARAQSAPRAVILDLNLPGKHGLDVLREIRATPETRLVPVVILSSSSEESDVRTGYELGANSYVQKPVDFDMFVEIARQIGLYWTSVNVPHA
jgi:two-component system response regulator